MVTASFDISGILAKTRRINKITQADMRGFVRRQMTLTISSSGKVPGVIQITAPFGKAKGSAAFQAGKKAIDRDLGGVFAGRNLKGRRKVTEVFGKKLKKTVFVKTTELNPDVEGIYKRRKGRRTRNQRLLTLGRKQPYFVAKSKLEKLRKKLQARVGFAAACWYQAGIKAGLTLNGVPAWVKRHTGAPGAATVRQTSTAFFMSVTNKAPYGPALDMARKAKIAIGYRLKAMQRELPRFISATLKKARAN